MQDTAVTALESAGHPVVRIGVADRYHIGQEFFRWEMATAVAGAILGINPFNQPDVEASKIKTRELTDCIRDRPGSCRRKRRFLEECGVKLFADEKNRQAARAAPARSWSVSRRISRAFATAITVRCSPISNATRAIAMRCSICASSSATASGSRPASGFGPRFLHSTGQAYKGGPNSGVFLQITCDDAARSPVPGQKYTFGVVKAAQARGDFDVLAERGRRVLRIHLGPAIVDGRFGDAHGGRSVRPSREHQIIDTDREQTRCSSA